MGNTCIQIASTIANSWPVFLPNSVWRVCVCPNEACCHACLHSARTYACVCVCIMGEKMLLGEQGPHPHTPTHTLTHTHTLSNTRQARDNTLIRYSILSGPIQKGQTQLNMLTPRLLQKVYYCWPQNCVAAPRVVEVVHLEGLTECHLHVCKSTPSVKLATDCHSSQADTDLYSDSVLLYFFFWRKNII